MYYNTTIFKKAGLNPPYNMEEFRSVARSLTKKDSEGKTIRYGFGFRINIDVFAVLFYLNKGKFFDEKETKALFNDTAGVEALQLLCDMHKDGTAFVTKEYLDNDFAAGRVASFFATTPRLAEMQELLTFKIGVAPLPGWRTQTAPIAGTNLAVFKKDSMTPEKQKLCWSFIKYISSAEGTSKWAAGTNYLPVRRSARETAVFRKYINENPLVMVGVRQLDRAVTDPRNKNWQAVRDKIGSAVEKALLEKATPKEALDEAASEVNLLLEKNK